MSQNFPLVTPCLCAKSFEFWSILDFIFGWEPLKLQCVQLPMSGEWRKLSLSSLGQVRRGHDYKYKQPLPCKQTMLNLSLLIKHEPPGYRDLLTLVCQGQPFLFPPPAKPLSVLYLPAISCGFGQASQRVNQLKQKYRADLKEYSPGPK